MRLVRAALLLRVLGVDHVTVGPAAALRRAGPAGRRTAARSLGLVEQLRDLVRGLLDALMRRRDAGDVVALEVLPRLRDHSLELLLLVRGQLVAVLAQHLLGAVEEVVEVVLLLDALPPLLVL